ncbi:GNAT family N-acetyltransferase [Nocardioides sp. B-3]|uniref:GNAT family N-acetyltransferase n=1 Tax=Nocardioides sp. B-3 TaxID=2895565 RepID=UPI002152AFF6|nr:GNAT family N-acetyltransferase [Nocardioides sp. B-3]UUZ61145.1 GNAT family N-acetyltransferase [Nocardioides sp. B-3]
MTDTDAFAVRRATPADAAVLGRLLWDFNTEFDSPTDPADVLAARFARILEYDNVIALVVGDAKGFALITLRPAIWFDGPVAQLEELYVVPSLRNWGIGTQLIAEARRILAELGSPELHINVDEVDEDTRRFYERHGFVNIEEGVDYRMLCYIGQTEG